MIAAEGIPDQEKLDRYVEDQRLSGVLILDENMRVVLQNSQNGDDHANLGKPDQRGVCA